MTSNTRKDSEEGMDPILKISCLQHVTKWWSWNLKLGVSARTVEVFFSAPTYLISKPLDHTQASFCCCIYHTPPVICLSLGLSPRRPWTCKGLRQYILVIFNHASWACLCDCHIVGIHCVVISWLYNMAICLFFPPQHLQRPCMWMEERGVEE